MNDYPRRLRRPDKGTADLGVDRQPPYLLRKNSVAALPVLFYTMAVITLVSSSAIYLAESRCPMQRVAGDGSSTRADQGVSDPEGPVKVSLWS